MTFTESNTVEQMILDSVAPNRHGEPLNIHCANYQIMR